MAMIVKGRELATDSWQLLDAGAGAVPGAIGPADDLIVPLPLWRAKREEWIERPGRVGLRVPGEEDPESFAGELQRFALIAIEFPKFTDGRGYSLAHLLRTRYAYRGELRAIGDIFRDHLQFLESCGFDAYVLRPGEDPAAALAAFAPFSDAYQGSARRPLPLFRRRHRARAEGGRRA